METESVCIGNTTKISNISFLIGISVTAKCLVQYLLKTHKKFREYITCLIKGRSTELDKLSDDDIITIINSVLENEPDKYGPTEDLVDDILEADYLDIVKEITKYEIYSSTINYPIFKLEIYELPSYIFSNDYNPYFVLGKKLDKINNRFSVDEFVDVIQFYKSICEKLLENNMMYNDIDLFILPEN